MRRRRHALRSDPQHVPAASSTQPSRRSFWLLYPNILGLPNPLHRCCDLGVAVGELLREREGERVEFGLGSACAEGVGAPEEEVQLDVDFEEDVEEGREDLKVVKSEGLPRGGEGGQRRQRRGRRRLEEREQGWRGIILT